MQKIAPCFWCDGNAEELARFYTSIFKNSKMGAVMRYPADAGPGKKGQVLLVEFELEGLSYTALNAGSQYKFTPAVSFYVNCETQAEIDTLWEKLGADGGAPVQCGWITDKFGVSWQIVPTAMTEMLRDQDTDKAARAFKAMMTMVKLDIAALKKAYAEG
jgi:predicted 3-demethylubiquinone-9 3-methyltransferase (glyoxalase superfamily)